MAEANGEERVEELEYFEEECGAVVFVDYCGGALRGDFAEGDVVCCDTVDTENSV